MWSTCKLKKFDVNFIETMSFRPTCNMSGNEIQISNNVVGNSTCTCNALVVIIKSPKKYLNSQKTNTNMHMWVCIDCSGFGVADHATTAIYMYLLSISNHTTIQYHWGEFFPHYSANRMYFQVDYQTKWESSRKNFHSLPVLHITFKSALIIIKMYTTACTEQ